MGIEQYLQQILSARYGRDVRQSIHDSIYEINEVAKKAEYDASTAPESAKAYAQAALASEQAAEDYKTAAEQAAQQAMSGTPEGYADLVAKVNSIYRQTATSYNVVGTSEGSALARTIYGMSVQDGTPTPSVPVEIKSAKADFRCTGKNLIPYPYEDGASKTSNGITYTVNSDGSITAQGTATGNAYLWFAHNFKIKQGVYKGTLNVTGESGNTYAIRYVNDAEGWSYLFYNNTNVTIPSDRVGTFGVRVSSGQTVDLTFKPQLVLATNSDLSYEVNQHTDVTTNITLRAIEVASTDDYNLERDGKYYIADTVDWSEDEGYVITRRVESLVFDGSENWETKADWTCDFGQNFGISTANLKLKNPHYNVVKNGNDILILSDAMIGEVIFYTPSVNEDRGNGIYRTKNYLYIQLNANTKATLGITSLESFKTWMANNNIEIIVRVPAYTEPITSEQAQALLSLKTYDEATSISATGDIEPSVDLEYSKDRNTALALTGHNLGFKNALKLNDINTALIELGGN